MMQFTIAVIIDRTNLNYKWLFLEHFKKISKKCLFGAILDRRIFCSYLIVRQGFMFKPLSSSISHKFVARLNGTSVQVLLNFWSPNCMGLHWLALLWHPLWTTSNLNASRFSFFGGKTKWKFNASFKVKTCNNLYRLTTTFGRGLAENFELYILCIFAWRLFLTPTHNFFCQMN